MTKTITPLAAPVSESRSNGHRATKSPVVKHSIIRNGHKSSVSLEDQFWQGLREIAARENVTVSTLVGTIDHGSNRRNLSSAIRVFVLDHFKRNSEQKLSVARPNPDSSAPSTAAPQLP